MSTASVAQLYSHVTARLPEDELDGNHGPAITAAEVVRLMAHELRQPLSTIESIAYYLNLVLPSQDGKAREQLSRLQCLIEQSNWILSNGVRCVEVSAVTRELVNIEEIVSTALAHWNSEIVIDVKSAGSLPDVRIDPNQGRHLVESLVTLFAPGVTETRPLRVSTRLEDGRVVLEFSGPSRVGLSQPAGSNLSVESARRIAQSNGATFESESSHAGTTVSVAFPVFGKDV